MNCALGFVQMFGFFFVKTYRGRRRVGSDWKGLS